ncbi:MAG: hotdog domain-containing protein [Bacteroidota bacterium]
MITKKDIYTFTTYHLIKSEDLNHHGSLFAGRSAEWFVEAGFIAAAAELDPNNLICFKIHGMTFRSPLRLGQTVCYTSRFVYAGRTSCVTNIEVNVINDPTVLVSGFITFVHVNEHTVATPHYLEMIPTNEYEQDLQDKAKDLKRKES